LPAASVAGPDLQSATRGPNALSLRQPCVKRHVMPWGSGGILTSAQPLRGAEPIQAPCQNVEPALRETGHPRLKPEHQRRQCSRSGTGETPVRALRPDPSGFDQTAVVVLNPPVHP